MNRILEQYLALEHYFVLVANEDPTHSNDRILKSLQNKFTLAYLESVSHQLQRFNVFNRLFQSERPLLHNLREEVEGLIKSIASDFMSIAYVKQVKPKEINPTRAGHHIPLHQVYVGVAATATMHGIKAGAKQEGVQKFRSDWKNFLIESILQIKQRFDLEAEIHDIVSCIAPGNAAACVPPSLVQIIQKLPYLNEILDTAKLDLEWREHVFEDDLKPDLYWDEYWKIAKDGKTPTRGPKYPNLTKFVEILASFPFSNALVERVFSILKRIKTEHRTSLKSSSLVALLQYRMAMKLKNDKLTSARLKPSQRALDLVDKMKASATDDQAKELMKKFLDQLFSEENV